MHSLKGLQKEFGDRDPILDVDEFLAPCLCGGEGSLLLDFPSVEQLDRRGGGSPKGRRRLHFVECKACRRRGLPAAADWAAAVEWNREHYNASYALSTFPFFYLDGSDLQFTRIRLNEIRARLESAVKAGRQSRRSGADVDPDEIEYLQAYLGWSIAGQTLVKLHRKQRHLQSCEPSEFHGAET